MAGFSPRIWIIGVPKLVLIPKLVGVPRQAGEPERWAVYYIPEAFINQMKSKTIFKVSFWMLLGIFLMWGCVSTTSYQTILFTETPYSPNTTKPTLILPTETIGKDPFNPSETSEPTSTPSSIPTKTPSFTLKRDPCARETIPANFLSGFMEADNNGLIAYTSKDDDIYVMNLDGTNRKNITKNPATDRFPVWSPDGKKIAFLSNRNYPAPHVCVSMVSNDCVFEIYTMDSNGANLIQISEGWNFSPVWSPDSKKIAYTFFYPEPNSTLDARGEMSFLSNIYLVDENGTIKKNLTKNLPPYNYTEPVWSPDSTKLAIRAPDGIVIVNIASSETLKYSNSSVHRIIAWVDNQLMFMNGDDDIYIASNNFKEIRQINLIHKVLSWSNVSFSQDGKWFIYQYSNDDDNLVTKCNQIRVANIETFQDYFVYDLDDVEKVDIPDAPHRYASSLSIDSLTWAKNGRIYFSQWVRYEYVFHEFIDLFSINVDGTELKISGSGGDIYSPAIQP